jgi:GR25 family glycosyltransferase involved in LPS biosynthesis
MNIKFFWINIDKSVGRRKFMEKQFEFTQTPNLRISAITPEKLPEVLEDKPPFFCGNSCCLNNNCNDCKFEYSCICSHLDAIKEGYKSGDDYFIVCEDDIYFPFKIDFNKMISILPNEIDIIQMMVLDCEGNDYLYDLYKNKNALFTVFNPSKRLFSTGMYLISRKGAEKLLNICINKETNKYDLANVNCIKQADFLLYMNVNTYTSTFPFCFPTLQFISEIHHHHYFIHKCSIDKIKSIIIDNQLTHPFISEYYPFDDNGDVIDFYWINLDKAVDRRKFMEEQFDKLKINNFRISAHTPNDFNEILIDKAPYFCGYKECYERGCQDCPIEYAVICSHLKAIQAGYNSGKNYFVVCEDDIEFPFKVNFYKLISSITKEVDIIQMMVISSGHTEFFYNNFYKNKNLFIRYNPITPSAGFYLCSREGAKKLLDLYLDKKSGKFNFSNCNYLKLADVLLFQSLNSIVTTMPLAIPNISFKSQIHTHHYEAHKNAYEKINEVIKDDNGKNPFILA